MAGYCTSINKTNEQRMNLTNGFEFRARQGTPGRARQPPSSQRPTGRPRHNSARPPPPLQRSNPPPAYVHLNLFLWKIYILDNEWIWKVCKWRLQSFDPVKSLKRKIVMLLRFLNHITFQIESSIYLFS